MGDVINLLQWPAMISTIAAAGLVASSNQGRRNVGFWIFLLSNAMWVAWGLHVGAPALIAMQVGLAAMNIKGVMKSGFGNSMQSRQRNTTTTASTNVVGQSRR